MPTRSSFENVREEPTHFSTASGTISVGTLLHVARAIAGQQQQGGVLEPEVAVVRRAVLQGPCVTIGGPGGG